MSRTASSPTWPFAIVLIILFGMSLTAPRGWEAHAQRRPLEPSVPLTADLGEGPAGRTFVNTSAPGPAATSIAAARPTFGGPPTLNRASTSNSAPRLSAAPTLNAVASRPTASATAVNVVTKPAAPKIEPQPTSPTQGVAEFAPSPVAARPPAPKLAAASQPAASQPAVTKPVLVEPAAPKTAAAPTAAETMFGAPRVAATAPSNGPRLNGTVAPTAPRVAAQVPVPAAAATAAAPLPAVAATAAAVAPRVADRRVDPQLTSKTPTGLEPRPIESKPESSAATKKPEGWWPAPEDLLTRLEKLSAKGETQRWADRAERLLEELTASPTLETAGVAETLRAMRALAADREVVDESRLDRSTAVELRLTRYALQRRLDVWEALANLPATKGSIARTPSEALEVCLHDIERQTEAAGETGLQWRKYLLIDALDEAAHGRSEPNEARALAREVLARIHRAEAQGPGNAFLHEGPFADLDRQLRRLAAQEVDARALLASIEQFESGGRPSDAKALAEQCHVLEASTTDEQRQLAVWLTSHYRNANVRLTLSADLLNRMMPEALRKNAPVRDTILGNPTHGWSTSRTGISIRFLPSQDTLAVRFDAKGAVASQTQTSSGPVRLFSHSNATFTAFKDLTLATDGFHVTPAKAQTQSKSRLRGIRTDFDHMPILGNIVESMALDAHAENRAAAQNEASVKISRQVERGLDAEIDNHLDAADRELNQRLLDPLAKLGLTPEVIELQSNEQRAIVRLRVAGDDQLAAYTPRPRAYSDNVGSLQIHQSAINNLLDRGGLQGRTFSPAELFTHLTGLLPLERAPEMPSLPEDVQVRFAAVDPVTIRCDDGHMELRLAIDELQSGARVWRDFAVRVLLKPALFEGRTFLVRDGLIRIAGPRLGTTSQISLRTAMAKVFPDDMRLDLWPSELAADPRFSDLTVAQVDLRDGWLAVAIGPTRHYPSASLFPPRRR